MRIRVEEKYSANFCKENVGRIAPYILPSSCLSVFCPSGVGMSRILRYISFNRKYRKKFRNIRKIKFFYFDLEEINSYRENILIENQFVELSASHLVKKFLLETINEQVNPSNSSSATPVENLRANLYKLIENTIKSNNNNPIFFVFDKVEKLLEINDEDVTSVIKSIRETFKQKVQYIFGFNDLKWLDKLEDDYSGPLAGLLTQKITVLGMLREGDFVQDLLDLDTRPFFKFFTKSRALLKQITKLSGGYAKYYKCLYSMKDLKELNSNLPTELKVASKKLLMSFTPNQVNILKNIANGIAVKQNRDTEILETTGIIKKEAGRISLFSPIMYLYIRSQI